MLLFFDIFVHICNNPVSINLMGFVMGDMADYYDDAAECRIARIQFLEIWNDFRSQRVEVQETPHLIYQNHLMDKGLSYDQRADIAAELYHINAEKKVHEECICPSCGAEFIKSHYQQKFCKSKVRGKSSCKDFFHNFSNPKRRQRLFWVMGEDMKSPEVQAIEPEVKTTNESLIPINFCVRTRSISSLMGMIEEGKIKLEYFIDKKGCVWDNAKRSQYIESLLIHSPTTQFVLNESFECANYSKTVVDGLQRLLSIKKFIDGDLQLSGLNFLHEYNGMCFSDFHRGFQRRIEETNINVIILRIFKNHDMARKVAIGYM